MHWVDSTCPSSLSLSPRGLNRIGPHQKKKDPLSLTWQCGAHLQLSIIVKYWAPLPHRDYTSPRATRLVDSKNGKIIRSIRKTVDIIFLDLLINKMLLFTSLKKNVIIYTNVTSSSNFYFLFIVLIKKLTHTFI